MTKLNLIKRILQNNEIRDWYATEHGVTVGDLTNENVRIEYSAVANSILEDGLKDGLITRDEYEQA